MKKFAVFLVVLALSLGIAQVLAQFEESPPQVVYISPTDDLALDSPITVMFNQPMQRDSVEAAWSIEPRVEGTFEWQNDYTVSFVPAGSWQRQTNYMITVAGSATNAGGQALAETYSETVKTVKNLQVTSVQPADGTTEVLADATITVAFNQPVVPLTATSDIASLPQPLVIEPATSGHGTWVNTFVYQWVPDEPLSGATTYTATVKAGLTDLTGAPLVADYRWSFTTTLPQITSVYPYSGYNGVALDSPVTIDFSQPMDRAATEQAFTLSAVGQKVSGAFEWSEDSLHLTFTPVNGLTIGTDYLLILDKAIARSVSGASLTEGYSALFKTTPLPFVSGVYPNSTEYIVYPGWQQLRINFGTEMDPTTLENIVTIEPQPEGVTPNITPYGITYEFDFLPRAQYTVTVNGEAKDIFGNALGKPYTATIIVQDTPPFQSDANMAIRSSFIVTGSYREATSIAVQVAGQPEMQFWLHRVSTENIWRTFDRLYNLDDFAPIIGMSQLIRNWTQTFDPETDYAYMRLNLASEQGGALEPGVYILSGLDNPTIIAVTNSTITTKRIADELFVWVTDMQTGAPLANQTVKVYHQSSFMIEGVTDTDGLVRLPVQGQQYDWLTIISQNESHYGVWRSYNPAVPSVHNVYTYTDRPIYRPGETLYYRGTYRQRDDATFFVNNQNALQLTIQDARGQTLLDQPLQLNDFGSFSGEIVLPDDVATGQLYINVAEVSDDYQRWYASAQVAEFRVPEYKVSVTAEQPEYQSGSDIKALVNTAYFSGGAVTDATVNWTANSSRTGFRYTGRDRYTFIDWLTYDYYSDTYSLASAQATTDAAGSFMIEIPDAKPKSMYPEMVTIEASISDESGQAIAGRTNVILHGTDTYIGVRTDKYFARENETITAYAIAVSPENEPIANEAITLKLIERRWTGDYINGWDYEDIEVDSVVVNSDQEGKVSHAFTPPNPGVFVVQASTTDYRSSAQIYVSGTSRAVRWGNTEQNTVTLIADKDSYVPGDTAQIFMQLPFEGTSYALITIERQGVMQHEVVKIEGSNLLYELPITPEHEPGVFVSVMLVHGIDQNNTAPAYAQQTIKLPVDPVNKRLNVTIKPSTTNAKPGDVVTLDISATDASGNPVRAEFGLMLVDAAILSLTGPNSISPEAHYYGGVSNQTTTDTMLSTSLDKSQDAIFGGEAVNEVPIEATPTTIPPQYDPLRAQAGQNEVLMSSTMTAMPTQTASGDFALAGAPMDEAARVAAPAASEAEADGNAAPVDVRSNFQQTPLWEAHVITDEQGNAQVSVTMPDNLTIWNLTARAVTADTLIGEVKLDISSTLPLLVRPVVPRFFVVNDEVTLGMVINNNTDQVQAIEATLEGTGYTFIGSTTADQTTLIQPNSRARIDWRVKIQDVEFVDLTFIARGNDGFEDASKPPLSDDGKVPVYRYTAPDTVGTAGVLRDAGARTEGIVIPPIADTNQGTLTVKLDHSLAAVTLDSLDYLQNYPHQCIEQTVSRFLPNLITMRALQKLNVSSPELEANLDFAMDFGLNRILTNQNYDGGWGWFPQQESNPYVTAYALLGLVEARLSGYDVPDQTLFNAVGFIRQQLITPNIDSNEWELNRQAFYIYVLARVGAENTNLTEMNALFEHRVEMSYGARAYLLMSYVIVGGNEQAQALADDLKAGMHVSATGAHWEEESVDWWSWGSDVRTTALGLTALLQVEPQNDLLPQVVRWLMIAREGDHWQSTQETVWSVMALTDWMVATQELEGNYNYTVTINDKLASSGIVMPQNVREGETLTVEVSELLLDEMNRMVIERDAGEGALYYTAHLQLELDASQVQAINRGISVDREYLINDEPVTEVNVGDVVTVRLTVTVPETIYYAVVESPLPAGAEAVDQSLLTSATSSVDNDPYAYPYDYWAYNPHYYWAYWVWDHTDIRDESVNLYADVLYPGSYVYSYEIRASVAGSFQNMPSHAYAFYFPEVFGRSDGELFTIK